MSSRGLTSSQNIKLGVYFDSNFQSHPFFQLVVTGIPVFLNCCSHKYYYVKVSAITIIWYTWYGLKESRSVSMSNQAERWPWSVCIFFMPIQKKVTAQKHLPHKALPPHNTKEQTRGWPNLLRDINLVVTFRWAKERFALRHEESRPLIPSLNMSPHTHYVNDGVRIASTTEMVVVVDWSWNNYEWKVYCVLEVFLKHQTWGRETLKQPKNVMPERLTFLVKPKKWARVRESKSKATVTSLFILVLLSNLLVWRNVGDYRLGYDCFVVLRAQKATSMEEWDFDCVHLTTHSTKLFVAPLRFMRNSHEN